MARRTGGGDRRTAAQTRALLLRAGVELLRERAGQDGDHVVAATLSHVRFTEVAQQATEMVRAQAGDAGAAKVTTGAIYNLWPNQVDYQVDLLLHVAQLQSVLVPGVDQSLSRFRAARDRGTPVDQVVADLARDVHRQYEQDPLFRVELGFLIGAHDHGSSRHSHTAGTASSPPPTRDGNPSWTPTSYTCAPRTRSAT